MTEQAQRQEAPTRAEVSSEDLALHIVDAAMDKKALDPTLIDVRGLASYTDFLVICTARNDRHVGAIVDEIESSLRDVGIRSRGIDGRGENRWVVLDFDDVIVHVFFAPFRPRYDLERFWTQAPRIELEIPDELRAEPSLYDGYAIDD